MIARLIMLGLSITIGATGWASQYGRNRMERVVVVRQSGRASMDLPAILPGVDGYVAVPECSHIGRILYARPVGATEWETFLVTDCAGPGGAYGWMARNNILIEVDFLTAQRWNTIGRGIKIEIGQVIELNHSGLQEQ